LLPIGECACYLLRSTKQEIDMNLQEAYEIFKHKLDGCVKVVMKP